MGPASVMGAVRRMLSIEGVTKGAFSSNVGSDGASDVNVICGPVSGDSFVVLHEVRAMVARTAQADTAAGLMRIVLVS